MEIPAAGDTGILILEIMNGFEEEYITLRKKEHRLYGDDEVWLLPNVNPSHVHYREWKFRRRSAERLMQYLERKCRDLNILEVGCGNGWLSATLAGNPRFLVTGTDINTIELSQARRVFGDNNQLRFVFGDIRNNLFPQACFDIIIFAASLQYFESLDEIMRPCALLLKHGGEVHILDTHFYKDENLSHARNRTAVYYELEGAVGMTSYYFHHSLSELKNYHYNFLGGNNIIRKALGIESGLPWVCINNLK